ncbi:Hypothetical Protein FCC1311_044932 [Hondaea fermentalgiana]|uniref:Uncharacterized protein n=1 Tax=Hondaea fermentalgiana TaxID=2315210 RepID=A0A2R5GB97_9STRA|nr:Hypothetical Protein FCC1311_044932 [Hondaea fermentalgiana]|eukprot:GBG28270.1 Hypothetical Protein FCC1311_044932 [Hondaea fermentalgiana]
MDMEVGSSETMPPLAQLRARVETKARAAKEKRIGEDDVEHKRRVDMASSVQDIVDQLSLWQKAHITLQECITNLTKAVEKEVIAKMGAQGISRREETEKAVNEQLGMEQVILDGMNAGIEISKKSLNLADADLNTIKKAKAEALREYEAASEKLSYTRERLGRCEKSIEREQKRKAERDAAAMEIHKEVRREAEAEATEAAREARLAKKARRRDPLKVKSEPGADDVPSSAASRTADENPSSKALRFKLSIPEGLVSDDQVSHNLYELVNARRIVRTLAGKGMPAENMYESGILPLLPAKPASEGSDPGAPDSANTSAAAASSAGKSGDEATQLLLPTFTTSFQIEGLCSDRSLDVSASPWSQKEYNMPPPPTFIPQHFAEVESSLAALKRQFQGTLSFKLAPQHGTNMLQAEVFSGNEFIKSLGSIPGFSGAQCISFFKDSGLKLM